MSVGVLVRKICVICESDIFHRIKDLYFGRFFKFISTNLIEDDPGNVKNTLGTISFVQIEESRAGPPKIIFTEFLLVIVLSGAHHCRCIYVCI